MSRRIEIETSEPSYILKTLAGYDKQLEAFMGSLMLFFGSGREHELFLFFVITKLTKYSRSPGNFVQNHQPPSKV